jgi:Lipopolysaccharide-assembly
MVRIAFLLSFALFLSSCYTFKGFSIDPTLETFRVETFEVALTASIAPPSSGIDFAQQLQDKIRGETRLRYKSEESDITFSGRITEFEVRAVAPRPGETSAANQLSVSIEVVYSDSKNDQNNWKQTWTQFAEFDANQDLLSVQSQLVDQINKRLLDDIFNRAFNNW